MGWNLDRFKDGLGKLLGKPGGADDAAPAGAALGASTDDPELTSRKRLGFIMRYAKDPKSDPRFADKPLVYRVMAEERAYQQAQLVDARKGLRALDADPGADPDEAARRRAELEGQIDQARRVQSQIFGLTKALTGQRQATGSGLMAVPVDTSLPVEDMLGEAFEGK